MVLRAQCPLGTIAQFFHFVAEEKKKDDKKTKAFYDWATTGIPVISTSKFFQRVTKLHEPVRRMQFVVFEKISKWLFSPNYTRKIMWLRIYNIHEKIRDSLSWLCKSKASASGAKIIYSNLQVTLCVRSKQPRTIKTIIYNDIFTTLRRNEVQSPA